MAAAALAAAAIASFATPAHAGQPAICDQYPNLPICDEGGEGPGPDGDGDGDGEQPAGGGGPGGDGAGPTGDADGTLPFTGYPITDLLLLLLALLAAGIAIRVYLAARDRLRRSQTPA